MCVRAKMGRSTQINMQRTSQVDMIFEVTMKVTNIIFSVMRAVYNVQHNRFLNAFYMNA